MFNSLYNSITLNETEQCRERYLSLMDSFARKFGTSDTVLLFSVPGRTEIGGNHTDHQHGHVLAASVTFDIIAAARANGKNVITVHSQGFPTDTIDLSDLSPRASEHNQSAALIRGIAAQVAAKGYPVGGFDAYTISYVPAGSGLSSSASFEVLIGNILNSLFCEKRLDAMEIAHMGQYAENNYFGKPCGLMDQAACSVGGIISIDFSDPAAPIVVNIDFSFADSGYALCMIDTGAGHADLTAEYADIPAEMRKVAACLGKEFLRDADPNCFWNSIPKLRKEAGDRAVLRAAHFFTDEMLVQKQAAALKACDFQEFLRFVRESGLSSFRFLQNVIPAGRTLSQEMAVALMVCEHTLDGRGSCRVHGGGFAGAVQAYVPQEMLDEFKKGVDTILGQDSCRVMSIRSTGGVEVICSPV